MTTRQQATPLASQQPARRWHESRLAVLAIRIVVLATFLIAWEIYSGGVRRALLAPPSAVLAAFREEVFVNGDIFGALGASAQALVAGFALSAVFGIVLGVLMGRNRTIERLLDPYVSFLYALPTVALIPVLVVWFGIELPLRVAIVFLSGVFIVIVNTAVGVKNVDEELVDLGRVNCATETQMIRTIVLPYALPYIFAGLRVAFAQCLIGVIVAEMTTSLAGMGRLIVAAANRFRTAEMLVPIFVIMFVAIVLTGLLGRLQRRVAPWQAARPRQ